MLTLILLAALAADLDTSTIQTPTVEGVAATYVLKTREDVWDVATTDLTGSGFVDILVVTCDEESYPLVKAVEVFISDDAGAYPGTATVVLPLKPSISVLFLAEMDGVAPKELVAIDAAGACVFDFRDGGFEPIAEPRFTSLLPSASKEPLFLKKAAEDLDGDGIDEWLIPSGGGYDVRSMTERIASVRCDVVSEVARIETLHITHRLPAVHAFKVEGDATKNLAFLSDKFADFAHGPGWSEHKRFRVPVNLEEKWDASAKMVDIDKNGLPDLVVTQTKGTVKLESQTQVYVASAPFTYSEKPTRNFVSKGAFQAPMFQDVDGDDQLDAIFITIHMGLKFFVNLFLRGKLSITAEVFLFDGKGFGEKPDVKTNLTMPVPEGREQVAYAMADFNNDGRLDLMFGHKDDMLAFYTGEKDRFISSRPWTTVECPGFGFARPYDLNGNDAQDLVLFHPSGEHSKRVDAIVF